MNQITNIKTKLKPYIENDVNCGEVVTIDDICKPETKTLLIIALKDLILENRLGSWKYDIEISEDLERFKKIDLDY